MEHISKHLQVVKGGQALTEWKPLKTGDEQKLEVAIEQKKIAALDDLEPLKQALRYCMLLVGIRANNLPGENEKFFLINYICNNYAGHTPEEIKLAFDMAVQNKLDIDPKDVTAYENFSVAYFSRIMNAYQRWAAQAYRPTNKEEQPKITQVDWRQIIEKDYQVFLTGRTKEYRKYPVEFYEILVIDGFIHPWAYKDHIDTCRNKLIGEINKQLVDNRAIEDEYGEKYSEEKHLEKKIIEYRNKSRDAEVVLLSKQCIVWMLFKKAVGMKMKNIYVLG